MALFESLFLEMALFLSASSNFVDVAVTVWKNSPVALVDDKFVGVTLDSKLLSTAEAWGGLNLSSPKVQLLAKGLAPSYLRIGGAHGDDLTFDPTGHEYPNASMTFTGPTWDIINTFVQTVGWDLIFGLNALKRKDGQWDPTNAEELFRYTSEKQHTLAGLELGNEPRAFPARYNITGTQLGRDFLSLKTLLTKYPDYQNTLILGPDVASVTNQFFADFVTGDGGKAANIITIHHYYANGETADIKTFTDLDVMNSLAKVIEAARNVTKRTNPITPTWLGETSSCYGGGAPGLSDTYVAGFLWLDKLGVAASNGILGVLRQDFYYGNYPLIKAETFDPLPDYWLTLMYKRLVGFNVLKVESNNPNVRTYGHCVRIDNLYGYMPGSVVMYILVIGDDMVKLTFPQFKNETVDVFWLEPVGDLLSQTVSMNGLPLELMDGKFPEFPYVTLTEDELYLPGKTFGFLVFPSVNLGICIT